MQKKNKGVYKPYLANINVRWGSFDLDNLQEMRFEDDEDERYGIRYGDLIICEGGEPGRCAIWKEQIPNMKIQKALHRVRVNEEMDYRYLYYWFLLAGKQGALKQYYTGATIAGMMKENPKRVDYYERYQKIIEEYNSEQDRANIEKTFMELMDLANSMNQEEQRYVREGFTSDEELSMYDMLFNDELSKEDIKAIKKVAVDLLSKIKTKISELDH